MPCKKNARRIDGKIVKEAVIHPRMDQDLKQGDTRHNPAVYDQFVSDPAPLQKRSEQIKTDQHGDIPKRIDLRSEKSRDSEHSFPRLFPVIESNQQQGKSRQHEKRIEPKQTFPIEGPNLRPIIEFVLSGKEIGRNKGECTQTSPSYHPGPLQFMQGREQILRQMINSHNPNHRNTSCDIVFHIPHNTYLCLLFRKSALASFLIPPKNPAIIGNGSLHAPSA